MKKLFAIVLTVIICLICAPFAAAEDDSQASVESITRNIENKLEKGMSGDIKKELDSNGIKVSSPSTVGNIKPKSFIQKALSYFTQSLKAPFSLLGKMIAVCLVAALIKAFSISDSSLGRVIDILCLICTVLLLTDTVQDSLLSVRNSIQSINTYLAAYLPVFAGITTAGGNLIGSNGYMAIMLLVCEFMCVVATRVLIPFLSIVLAFSLVSAVNPRLGFSDIASGVKKAVMVCLGLLMTVFTGLMTIQGIVGASVDNVSSKALKFAASSFIPVIGGSVSEAYSTVKGSLGVIRSTVGSVGIIVLFIIVAKPLLSMLAVKLTVFLAKLVNDVFGQSGISSYLQSVNSILSIAMSIIIAYAIIFTVSTTILMLTAFNLGG